MKIILKGFGECNEQKNFNMVLRDKKAKNFLELGIAFNKIGSDFEKLLKHWYNQF